jgi:hypothetical protein
MSWIGGLSGRGRLVADRLQILPERQGVHLQIGDTTDGHGNLAWPN